MSYNTIFYSFFMAKCRINLYDICHTLELGKFQIKIFINYKVMINWTKTGLWLQPNFTRVKKSGFFFGNFGKIFTYLGAIWLKPWSFTNNNLLFRMVIIIFWFSGFFPSKRGVRGVTPSYEESPRPMLIVAT